MKAILELITEHPSMSIFCVLLAMMLISIVMAKNDDNNQYGV